MNNSFFSLPLNEQIRVIEAIIFASESPISLKQLSNLITSDINFLDYFIVSNEYPFTETSSDNLFKDIDSHILYLIEELNSELKENNRPYSVVMVGGGYTFATNSKYGKILSSIPLFKSKKHLTKPMLETLTIIAYYQPITKPEIEKIRGVNSTETINTLLDKGLIRILGRKDSLGKPLLYGTTNEFLKLLGINSLEELPKLSEITPMLESQNHEKVVELKINFDEGTEK
ncbi:MAG: SMC-Scp complex subunit ScpB [Candidatus Kapaibacteriales bacterium]